MSWRVVECRVLNELRLQCVTPPRLSELVGVECRVLNRSSGYQYVTPPRLSERVGVECRLLNASGGYIV